jgi:hypothetical protein
VVAPGLWQNARPRMPQPTDQELFEKIAQLRAEAKQLMQRASALEEKAAKLEDILARRQQRESSKPGGL